MKTNIFSPDLLNSMDAYWRAANYLSVGQIFLYDSYESFPMQMNGAFLNLYLVRHGETAWSCSKFR